DPGRAGWCEDGRDQPGRSLLVGAVMSEAEWLLSDNPRLMLREAEDALGSIYPHAFQTTRKRTFFAVACCRLVWSWIVVDERCRRLVEHWEQQIDEDPKVIDREGELEWAVEMAANHPAEGTPRLQSLAASMVLEAGVPYAA